MSEAAITAEILALLATIPNSEWSKNHGSAYGKRGRPDIQGTIRDSYEPGDGLHRLHCLGRTFAFEVKTKKGEVTSWQQRRLEELRKAGAVAEVVRSARAAADVLERYGIRTASLAEAKSSRHGERLTPTSLRKLLKHDAPGARRRPKRAG